MGMTRRPGLTDGDRAVLRKELRVEEEAGTLTPQRRAHIIAKFARHPDHPVLVATVEQALNPKWNDEQIKTYRQWYERLADDGTRAQFIADRVKHGGVTREYATQMLTGEYESPETARIAELERQLADARAVVGIKPKPKPKRASKPAHTPERADENQSGQVA